MNNHRLACDDGDLRRADACHVVLRSAWDATGPMAFFHGLCEAGRLARWPRDGSPGERGQSECATEARPAGHGARSARSRHYRDASIPSLRCDAVNRRRLALCRPRTRSHRDATRNDRLRAKNRSVTHRREPTRCDRVGCAAMVRSCCVATLEPCSCAASFDVFLARDGACSRGG